MTRHPRWTEAELAFVESHPDWTAADIGERIGRTRAAVMTKRHQLANGLIVHQQVTGAGRWTPQEDDFLLQTAHLSAWQVAEKIGRTRQGVIWRRRVLKSLRGVDFGDYATRNKDPHWVGARTIVAKTCRRCGLLLDRTWFHTKSGEAWRSACKRCNSDRDQDRIRATGRRPVRRDTPATQARSREYMNIMQALTTKHAQRSRDEWTNADYEILADSSLTILEKALKLGRTWTATASRQSMMGYASKGNKGLEPESVRWLIDAPNAAALLDLIAAEVA